MPSSLLCDTGCYGVTVLILQILLLKRWPSALLWVRHGGWQRDHVKIHGQCSSWLKVQFRRGLCKPQASVTVKYKSKTCLLHPPTSFFCRLTAMSSLLHSVLRLSFLSCRSGKQAENDEMAFLTVMWEIHWRAGNKTSLLSSGYLLLLVLNFLT